MSDLYEEAEVGRRYQEVWNNYAEPFFVAKTAELFNGFKDCKSTDQEGLLLLKLQLNCLDMLKDEFQYFITTGKMAQMQIDEFEQNSNQK